MEAVLVAYPNFKWCWNVVGVQGSEYLLLVYLAEQANLDGVTPQLPVHKIMEATNISRGCVFRYLKRLETKGFLRRKQQTALDRSQEASIFIVNMKRYFPTGDYDEKGVEMWKQIVGVMDQFIDRRIPASDLRVLRLIREALYQRVTRTLWMLTSEEYIYDVFFRKEFDREQDVNIDNLRLIKESAVSLDLPIRRFQFFIKPNRPGRRQKNGEEN